MPRQSTNNKNFTPKRHWYSITKMRALIFLLAAIVIFLFVRRLFTPQVFVSSVNLTLSSSGNANESTEQLFPAPTELDLTGKAAFVSMRNQQIDHLRQLINFKGESRSSMIFSQVDEKLPWITRMELSGDQLREKIAQVLPLVNPLLLLSPEIVVKSSTNSGPVILEPRMRVVTISPKSNTLVIPTVIPDGLSGLKKGGNAYHLFLHTFNALDLGFPFAIVSNAESNGIEFVPSTSPIRRTGGLFGPMSGTKSEPKNGLLFNFFIDVGQIKQLPAVLAVKLFDVEPKTEQDQPALKVRLEFYS